ncbi:MAG: hypothetical protein CMO01_33260 [Thalassobius sp.]|nr:hypothetical protein [Thalassovita sp.]
MKYIVLYFTMLLFVACSEDSSLIPNIYTGKVTALKNGQTWETPAYFDKLTTETGKYMLRADFYDKNSLKQASFSIRNIAVTLEKQNIRALNNDNNGLTYADFMILIDGDAIDTIYELDTSAIDNYIKITNYDSRLNEIKGEFKVSFKITDRDANNTSGKNSEKIEFSNGNFNVKVNPEWFE